MGIEIPPDVGGLESGMAAVKKRRRGLQTLEGIGDVLGIS
jgi:hypothetical protein